VVLDRRLPAAVLKMVSNLLPAKLGDALSGVSDTQQAVHMLEASAEAVLLKYDVVHPTTKTLMVRFYDWAPLDVERAQLQRCSDITARRTARYLWFRMEVRPGWVALDSHFTVG